MIYVFLANWNQKGCNHIYQSLSLNAKFRHNSFDFLNYVSTRVPRLQNLLVKGEETSSTKWHSFLLCCEYSRLDGTCNLLRIKMITSHV